MIPGDETSFILSPQRNVRLVIHQVLTIVIPALNEEDSIGMTIERCLEAREGIARTAGLDDVEILVVSDGSTDRTAEIARAYDAVQVIEFPENQGYGAAIKAGWQAGRGTLLGFLDADGTCDPRYFEELCAVTASGQADIALGSRMGPDSQMPRIRRLGNRIYAVLLGFLCGRHITDTASGMRIVRREVLEDLYPLPDGLHFTPAMSSRALLNHLRVVEIPMRYEERIGTSKLNVLRDGVRFVKAILDGVLCYRPEKIFLMAFAFCLMLMVLFAATPTEYYFQNRRLEDWMIYRFAVCSFLGSLGLLLLLATALSNQMACFSRRRPDGNSFWAGGIRSLLSGWRMLTILAIFAGSSVGFLWPGLLQWITTGQVTLHWSRLLAGAFCLLSAFQTGVFVVLLKVVGLWITERSPSSHRFKPLHERVVNPTLSEATKPAETVGAV